MQKYLNIPYQIQWYKIRSMYEQMPQMLLLYVMIVPVES